MMMTNVAIYNNAG